MCKELQVAHRVRLTDHVQLTAGFHKMCKNVYLVLFKVKFAVSVVQICDQLRIHKLHLLVLTIANNDLFDVFTGRVIHLFEPNRVLVKLLPLIFVHVFG